MTLKELKELVRDLVSRARSQKAIDEIIKWAKENDREELKKDAAHLKGNLAELNREKNMGIISTSEASTRQSKISYSILNLLESVEEDNPTQDKATDKTSSGNLKILMLTANPATSTKLNLDKEYAVISQKLEKKRGFFNIILKKAVSGTEFKEFTEQEEPSILHFSGHGEKGKYAGIVVQNDDKNGEDLIPINGLKSLFKYFKKYFNIKVVLLNACHTQEQAAAISEYVDYVIGTNVAIKDTAACAFSSGFYFRLTKDKPMNIENAFDSGRAEATFTGAAEENFVIYRHGKLIEV